jgi:hypothetical protein
MDFINYIGYKSFEGVNYDIHNQNTIAGTKGMDLQPYCFAQRPIAERD